MVLLKNLSAHDLAQATTELSLAQSLFREH